MGINYKPMLGGYIYSNFLSLGKAILTLKNSIKLGFSYIKINISSRWVGFGYPHIIHPFLE